MPPVRVERRERGMHPVGPGWQCRIGQHRPSARGAHRLNDLRIARRDGDGTDSRLPPAIEHMENHRPAGDVRQRLAGQPGGGHPRGNNDNWVHEQRFGGLMGAGHIPMVRPTYGCAASGAIMSPLPAGR